MNYKDLIDAHLADVLIVPHIRALNLALLWGPPRSERWAAKAAERYQFMQDARERGSDGRDPL